MADVDSDLNDEVAELDGEVEKLVGDRRVGRPGRRVTRRGGRPARGNVRPGRSYAPRWESGMGKLHGEVGERDIKLHGEVGELRGEVEERKEGNFVNGEKGGGGISLRGGVGRERCEILQGWRACAVWGEVPKFDPYLGWVRHENSARASLCGRGQKHCWPSDA